MTTVSLGWLSVGISTILAEATSPSPEHAKLVPSSSSPLSILTC